MHKLLILLAAAFLVSCGNADQKPASGNALSNDTTGTVAMTDTARYTTLQWVDSTFQDLGKVNEGQQVDIIWKMRNTGTNPLVIVGVTPGCGCTVAEKPTAPIAPGAEGTIRARFDSNNQSPGIHRKSVTVVTNTPEKNHYLTFQVDINPK